MLAHQQKHVLRYIAVWCRSVIQCKPFAANRVLKTACCVHCFCLLERGKVLGERSDSAAAFLVLSRKWDDTPMKLTLDKGIAEQLMVGQLEKLKRDLGLTQDEYLELVANTSYSRTGTCNVLVQSLRVRWPQSAQGECVFIPPAVIQRNTASNILAALEAAVPDFSLESLGHLARRLRIGVLILTKDSAGSNNLATHVVANQLPSNFLLLSSPCDAHLVNRMQQSLLQHLGFPDPLHGFGLLLRHHDYAVRFLVGLAKQITLELDWVQVAPDPMWQQHSRNVVMHTIFRQAEMVRAAVHPAFPQPHKKAPGSIIATGSALLQVCNGNWLQPRISHHCVGNCCVSRAEAVQKVIAAVTAYAKMMTDVPAMSRWQGPVQLASQWGCLAAMHGLGVRAWLRAFPEEQNSEAVAELPDNVPDEQARRAETSRRLRSQTRFAADEKNHIRLLLHSMATQPLDALISYASAIASAKRAPLKPHIFAATMDGSPVAIALNQLQDLLKPGSCMVRLIDSYADLLGSAADVQRTWGGFSLQCILHNAAGVFSRLGMLYNSVPYKTFGIVNPQCDREVLARELLAMPSCCIDHAFTGKLLKLAPTVRSLTWSDVCVASVG